MEYPTVWRFTECFRRYWRVLLSLALIGLLLGCGEHKAPATVTGRAAGTASIPLGKLPNVAQPLAYRINLAIDPDQTRFSGEVEIDLKLSKAVDRIYLHGSNLTMHEIWFEGAAGRKAIPAENFTQLSERGVALLRFPGSIQPGNLTLGFSYDAPYADDLAGVYKVNSGGHAYIFTQFEEIDARRAFPGFDEPRFKTPFTLSITLPLSDRAAANTPVESESLSADGAQRTVNFLPTQPLPTYLVGFTVGPLEIVESAPIPVSDVRTTPIPLRGIAVKGAGKQLTYALAQAAPLVLEFEHYFGVAYPFAKLDLVAVPDFAAGAMENAGLITFRDNLLLLRPDAPASQKRSTVAVNAHEIAHQWFGDLVTMPWWDDIWLNESFATWAGNRTAAVVHPDFYFERGLQASALAVMAADSRQSVRRIHEPVNNADDITNAFDGITYQKGGAVLRMFEAYLGSATFQKGIQAYLRKYALRTATAADFFAAMAAAAGDPMVEDGFKSFVDQKGVPLLKIAKFCVGQPGRQTATLEVDQSRYLPLGSVATSDKYWTVPFCYRTSAAGAERSSCTLLYRQHSSIGLQDCPDWIMPNRDGSGYYRWVLAPDDQERLGEAFDSLTSGEQLSLADSINAGFAAGTLDVNAFMLVATRLAQSDTRQVVTSPARYWRWMHDHLSAAARKGSAQRMRAVYGERLRQLEKNSSRRSDQDILRRQLSRFLARYGRDPALRAELVAEGESFLRDDHAEHPVDWDRLQLALTLAIEDAPEGTQATIKRLHQRLSSSDSSIVRNAILGALAKADTGPSLLAAQQLFFSRTIKTNERVTLFFGMSTAEHRVATWQWFQKNYASILATLTVGNQSFLPLVGRGFCSEERAQELAAFFNPRVDDLLGAKRILEQTLEDIRMCKARSDRHMAEAEAYFKNGVKS